MWQLPQRALVGLFLGTLAATVGCAGQAPPTAAPGPAASSGPVTPKVDRVVMGLDPVNVESNALRIISSPDVWIFRSVYEYPIALDLKTGKIMPGLATEWAIEPNGLDYRVKLRKGVQFHDNWGELTAKDFVHMWKDITAPEAAHGQTQYWRAGVKDVEVVNDYEVVYRLTKPDAQFVLALSETQGGAEIRSKAQFDKNGGPPKDLTAGEAGTGWYQFESRQTGTSLKLKRIPYPHWDGITPDFPGFEFRFLKEASTRVAALLSGEIHLAALPQDLQSQAERSGMKIIKGLYPGVRIFGQWHCCYFNESKNPSAGYRYPNSSLMDLRVRKALDKAINKSELNKAFFGGKGEPMIVNAYLPSRDGWNPEWEKRYAEEYGYDPERAKALLAEAGFNAGNPLKTSMFLLPVPGIAGGPDIEEAIAQYWRAVGVNVELLTIDGGDYTSRNRAFQFSNAVRITGTGSNQWTGVTVFNSGFFGQGGGGAQDPELDRLLVELTKTYDAAQRETLWRQAGDVMFNHHLNVSLFWLPAEATVNPMIVGGWVFPGGITGTWTHIHLIKAAR